LIRLGQEPLEDEWANQRSVTKNYERVDVASKGGERNEDGEHTAEISDDDRREE
ncbi:portal protein, partial [Bacillus cereus]